MTDRPALRVTDDPVSHYGWMRVEAKPSAWYLLSRGIAGFVAGFVVLFSLLIAAGGTT